MKMRSVLLLITPSSPGRYAGIARFARAHAWHLTVADRLTHALDGWTGDGALVTLRDDARSERHVRALAKRGIPVVNLTFARPDAPYPRVAADNAAIGRLAAEHFRSRYFRHVAWFSTAWGYQHERRFDAFAETCGGRPAKWVWSENPAKARTDDWNTLSKWLRSVLAAAEKPLGVFCFDDADASCVESAALAAGLAIPADVAVLGAGNDVLLCENQAVPISSVRHNLERIGYAGAAMLARLMDGGRAPNRPLLIPPRDVSERASTDTLALSAPLVMRARAVYLERLANPPSTEMLADELGVSRPTLDRAFNADIGLPPAKFLARLRLEEAKRLLKTTAMTASEISSAVGYCNGAYFSNAFRRSVGASPKAWRKSAADGG